MIEVTSCHMECTRFTSDYSQMPAVALFTFWMPRKQARIDDNIFFRPFARHRWLCVLEGGIVRRVAPRTSSSCHAKHLFVLFLFFLLVCFRRLSTLLPPLCAILVFTMCICVLLLYASKITHTYFFIIIKAR